MINLNDPFYGTMFALIILLAFAGYIAFFTELKEEPRKKKS
jgi:hypothetical protein